MSSAADLNRWTKAELVAEVERLRGAADRLQEHRVVADQLGLPYQSLDSRGRIKSVNRSWLRAMGYRRDEVIGRPFRELMSPDSARVMGSCFREFKASGYLRDAEFELIRKDGRTLVVAFNGKIERDARGRVAHTHCIFLDITERREAEQALREERDRARLYFDATDVLLLAVDAQGRIERVNRAGAALLGWKPEELRGRSWTATCLPPGRRKELRATFCRFMAQGAAEPKQFEAAVMTRDGQERLLRWHSTQLRDSAGQVTGTFNSGIDITAQRQADEQLEYHARLLELVSDAVISIDTDLRVVTWNRGAEQIYGWSTKEAIGRSLPEVTGMQEVQELLEQSLEAIDVRGSWSGRVIQRHRDGAELHIEAVVTPVFDKEGRLTGAVGINRDVSVQVLAEQRLSERQRNLQEAERLARLGWWTFDCVSQLPTWSAGMYRIFGLDAGQGEPTYAQHRDLIHPDDFERFDQAVARAVGEGIGYRLELRLVWPSGEVRHIVTQCECELGADGKVAKLIGAAQDVTEQVHAREALRESEARYRTLVETSPDAVVEIGLDGTVLTANRAAAELGGFSDTEDLIGGNVLALGAGLPAQETEQLLGQAFAEGSVSGLTLELWQRGGAAIVVEASAAMLYHHDGAPRSAVVAAREVTDRVRAERELELTLAAITDGVWKWDFVSDTMFFSDRYYAMLGYEPGAFPASFESWIDLIHSDDRERAQATATRFLENDRLDYNNRFRMRTSSGEYRWIHARARVVERDDQGRALRLIGNHEDVTELSRAEAALRESEERYRILAESSLDAIFVIDRAGRVDYANRFAAALFGHVPERIIGRPLQEMFPPQFGQQQGRRLDQVFSTGRPESAESEVCFPTRTVWLQTSLVPLRNADGQVARVLGVSRDLTERRRAEARVEEQAALLQQVSDAIISTDNESRIRSWNRAAEQLFGYSEAEVLGRVVYEVLPVTDPTDTDDEAAAKFAATGRWSGMVTQHHRNGERVRVSAVTTQMRDIEGRPTGIVAVGRDITELERAESVRSEQAALLQQVSDAIISTDAEFNIRSWNLAAEQIYGWSEAEALGRRMSDLSPITYLEDSAEEARVALRQDGVWRGEISQQHRDGMPLTISSSVTMIRDDQGQPTGAVAVNRDITALRNAFEAKRESEQRARTLIEAAPDGILLFDADRRRFIEANPTVRALLGRSLAELQQMDWEQISTAQQIDGESARDAGAVLERRALAGEETMTEWTFIDSGGEVLETELRLTRLPAKGRRLIRASVIDIGARKQAGRALLRSEQQFRSLFNDALDMIHVVDRDGRIVDVNRRELAVLGYAREELIGMPLSEVVVPDYREATAEKLRDVLEGENQGGFHTALRTRAGETVFVEVNAVPELVDGEVVAARAILRDMGERLRAEHALRESEARFRQLFEHMSSGVAIYLPVDGGHNFVFQDINAAGERLSMCDRHSLIGRQLTEAFPGVEALGLLNVLRRVARTGRPENLPASQYQDGRLTQWVDNRVFALPSGEVVAIYDDVTAEYLAEQALRDSEEKFRSIVEQLSDGLLLVNDEGLVLECNRAYLDMTGFAAEDVLGTPLWKVQLQLAPPEIRKEISLLQIEQNVRSVIERLFAGGEVAQSASAVVGGDGALMPVEITVFPIATSQEQMIGAMMRDVTERHQSQAALEAEGEKLRALASELTVAEERARRHLANLLHDQVGQSLALIKMKLGALAAQPSAQEHATSLGELLELSEQCISGTRGLTYELSPPVLHELGLEAALAWLVEQHHQRPDIVLRLDDDGAYKPVAEEVKILLFSAARELLHNVVKHAHAGHVAIKIGRSGAVVELEVADDGVGFDATELDRIGVITEGFGLFSIRQRLSAMGGSVELTTAPGEGTRVKLVAPLAQ